MKVKGEMGQSDDLSVGAIKVKSTFVSGIPTTVAEGKTKLEAEECARILIQRPEDEEGLYKYSMRRDIP